MVKAKGIASDREVVILGLSFANLNRFLEEAGDTYIKIRAEEMNIPFDIMIVSGETEADIVKTLSGGFDENTKVHLT